jgi:exopolysaccharide biosynthesis polyprenyl glycosylphosphotransferase
MATAPKAIFPDSGDGLVQAIRARKSISLHFSERKLLLALIDTALLNSMLLITLFIRADAPVSPQLFFDRWFWFVSLTGVWFICAISLECYNLSYAANIQRSLKRAGTATILTTAVYPLIPYVTPTLPTSRFVVFAFPVLGLLGIASWRIVYSTVFVRPGFQQSALIVGAGQLGRALAHLINETSCGNGKSHYDIGYQILGFIDDDVADQELLIANVPTLGTSRDLVQIASRLHVDELIIADDLIGTITPSETIPGHPQRRRLDMMRSALFAGILECREMGISITTTATLYERLTGRIPVEHIGRAFNVVLPLSRSATHRFYLVLRRLFDIAVSLIGCALLAAAIPLIWLANAVWSPGPLFYVQERVGKGGQPFWLIKFRSMVVDAEQHSGTIWASEHDPRITPIGQFLRKTRLDEIPQFWNILKGDMSFIGPRPERPYFVNQLAAQILLYRLRHAVKPGLTGWAQVKYRYGASVEDAMMKLQYDLYYIKHQGVLLDLQILLGTIPVVLGLKGR